MYPIQIYFSKSAYNIQDLYGVQDHIRKKDPIKLNKNTFNGSCSNLQKKSEKTIRLPRPLINLGSNCYLNSTLQSISSSNFFIEDIRTLHNQYNKLEKLFIFHKLLSALHNGSSNPIEISRNSIFKNWNKSGQQDCFELLSYVINQVYVEIRLYLEDSGEIPKKKLQKWFNIPLPLRIIVEYQIQCGCGNFVTIPHQSDLALHIPMPMKDNMKLQYLVDQYFSKDVVSDFICDNRSCNGMNAMKRIRLIDPLPRTICVHLQKSRWTGTKMIKIKNKVVLASHLKIRSRFFAKKNGVNFKSFSLEDEIMSISIDNELDMEANPRTNVNAINNPVSAKPSYIKLITLTKSNNNCKNIDNIRDSYTKPNIELVDDNLVELKLDSPVGKDDDMYVERKRKEYVLYDLCSVIEHNGSVSGGHYVCYRCVDNQWFFMSDYRVKRVPKEQVYRCDPYMLIYEQRSL